MMTFHEPPLPNYEELKRSNLLTLKLKEEIEKKGPISFATFMEMALYYPHLGYYNAESTTLGKEGDFTTAPEISPLFAQCFAKQCQQILNELGTGDMLELGAGTGRFAKDILTSLHKLGALPNHYYIYEISHGMRQKQQDFLRKTCPLFFARIIWLDTLPSAFTGIIIANEVLDALPVHCFQIENNEIKERCVTVENNQFTWCLRTPTKPQLTERVLELKKHYHLPEQYASEMNLHLPTFIKQLISTLTKGMVLFADYGYGQQEYYHPKRSKGTLTCFYQHKKYENPLWYPGLFDITAHVDFTSVIENAIDHGCELNGYTSQAAFLLSCGILELAKEDEKHLSPADEVALHQAIKLLTLPTEMGDVIKIMALSKQMNLSLLGFQFQDRRRDL